jgi:hypothetical protein
MRAPIVALIALLALGACTRGSPSPSARDAAPSDEPRWDVFTTYPRVTKLCEEHITAQGMHVLWRSFASSDPPETVATFYRERHRAWVVTDPASPGQPLRLVAPKDLVLTVHAVGTGHPTCASAPGAGDRTVILVSQAVR